MSSSAFVLNHTWRRVRCRGENICSKSPILGGQQGLYTSNQCHSRLILTIASPCISRCSNFNRKNHVDNCHSYKSSCNYSGQQYQRVCYLHSFSSSAQQQPTPTPVEDVVDTHSFSSMNDPTSHKTVTKDDFNKIETKRRRMSEVR